MCDVAVTKSSTVDNTRRKIAEEDVDRIESQVVIGTTTSLLFNRIAMCHVPSSLYD